jgi:hypothetical protein
LISCASMFENNCLFKLDRLFVVFLKKAFKIVSFKYDQCPKSFRNTKSQISEEKMDCH